MNSYLVIIKATDWKADARKAQQSKFFNETKKNAKI